MSNLKPMYVNEHEPIQVGDMVYYTMMVGREPIQIIGVVETIREPEILYISGPFEDDILLDAVDRRKVNIKRYVFNKRSPVRITEWFDVENYCVVVMMCDNDGRVLSCARRKMTDNSTDISVCLEEAKNHCFENFHKRFGRGKTI